MKNKFISTLVFLFLPNFLWLKMKQKFLPG
jgi:hypothetical protein